MWERPTNIQDKTKNIRGSERMDRHMEFNKKHGIMGEYNQEKINLQCQNRKHLQLFYQTVHWNLLHGTVSM